MLPTDRARQSVCVYVCMCWCVWRGENSGGRGKGERRGERREEREERREKKVEEKGEEKMIRVGILEQEVLCTKVLYHVGNDPNPAVRRS